VNQAFCSALPVAYARAPWQLWRAFAILILEAAQLKARRGASNVVLLTQLGGGAFGNEPAWIKEAMVGALRKSADSALHVKLVSYGEPTSENARAWRTVRLNSTCHWFSSVMGLSEAATIDDSASQRRLRGGHMSTINGSGGGDVPPAT
jgi:hypothetical protein